MPVRIVPDCCPKAVVSVTEMARMCQLSRSRFYNLLAQGIMPQPCYELRKRRPVYTRELQRQCLEIKATNVGVDGQFILFYQRTPADDRSPIIPRPRRRDTGARAAPDRMQGHTQELIGQLAALGLMNLTEAQVNGALQACFPSGHVGMDEGEVLRTLWRHLRQANAA